MNYRIVLVFIAGGLMGMGVSGLLNDSAAPAEANVKFKGFEKPNQSQIQVKGVEKDGFDDASALHDAQLRIKELEAQMTQIEAEEEGAEVSGGQSSEAVEKRRERHLRRLNRNFERKRKEEILSLNSWVSLSEEQKEAIKIYMEEKDALQVEHWKLTSGPSGEEDEDERNAAVEQISKELQSYVLEEYVQTLLEPEQKEEYDAYQEQKMLAQYETMAYHKLNQMQRVLRLDEAQKDRLFEHYYAQAEGKQRQQLYQQASQTARVNGDFDRAAYNEMMIEGQLQALDGLLDEEQKSTYRQYLELRMRR